MPLSREIGLVEPRHVRRDALGDQRRVRDAQLHLVRDQRLRKRTLEQLDLAGRLVRDAEGAYLARALQLVEGQGDVLRLDQGVRAVEQQDVEVVGPECRERLIHRSQDVLAREVEVAVADAHLRLDDHLIALGRRNGARVAEAALAAVGLIAVDVGVVEHRDAFVAGGADEGADLLVVERRDAHEAEDDVRRGDVGPGEGEGLHVFHLTPRQPPGAASFYDYRL